ncbi:MAG: DUF2179 domain-containing protein [Phycisphaerae bacterium]|jgi:uncharacterized protein YebE (UPF0316 family)|nr:DUF2179 domain-containing protein [Phycisphaerae bacterium]
MDWNVLFGALLIVAARVADVSLGTLRTVAVINGRKAVAWGLGFAEVLIWVLVVSQVITTVRENIVNAIAYALGFATGNFVGIMIEQYFAFGRQIIRVFTRNGGEMATAMRERGLRVTEFDGRGRDGPVSMLFVETERRGAPGVVDLARSLDPECYYTIGDIREASSRSARASSRK